MKILKILVLYLIIISINSTVFGQDLVTDRPDQTESALTVPKGSFQIETGVVLSYNEGNNMTERMISAPSSLFRLGISKIFEFRFINQFEHIKSNDYTQKGMSDIELGVKIQILNEDNLNTQIAFISHFVAPTGSNQITSDAYGTVNKLAVAHSVMNNIGIGYNLTYSYFGSGNGILGYSLALAYSINDKASVYIEPYGEYDIQNEYISNLDAGMTYLLSPNLQADFSFGTGLNNRMNYLAMGLSWRLLKNKSD